MGIRLYLTRDEAAAIRAQNRKGGKDQHLFRRLESGLDGQILTLDGDVVERSILCCEEHGDEDWQESLRSIAAKMRYASGPAC